jgi:hypothetical protein
MNYPKKPKDIQVRVIQRGIEDGIIVSSTSDTNIIPLSDKLGDYLVRLGYTNAHVLGIITQLMTQGKVRVDFRESSERIELVEEKDKISQLQTVSLLNDYVVEASKGQKIVGTQLTQNITVQPQQMLKDNSK